MPTGSEASIGTEPVAGGRTDRTTPAIRPGSGTQAAVCINAMESAIPFLPAEAFENLLVISPHSPSRVEDFLVDRDVDPTRVGMVPVSASPTPYDGPVWTTSPVAPSDLTGLNIRYERAMRHVASGRGWLLVDNLQLLFMYASQKRVLSLLDQLARRARGREVTGAFSFARETVGDDTFGTLAGVFDELYDAR